MRNQENRGVKKCEDWVSVVSLSMNALKQYILTYQNEEKTSFVFKNNELRFY
jgi:hypothetical protein